MILAASTLGTIVITVVTFFILLLLLVAILLFTKVKLSPSGPVAISINREKTIEVGSGASWMPSLGRSKMFPPSACGGGGTGIQRECHGLAGGGPALPTETPQFSKKKLSSGNRLSA